MKIDTHQHFWNLDKGGYPWLTPDYGPLYRTYEPPELEVEDDSIILVYKGKHASLFTRRRGVDGVGLVVQHARDQLQYCAVVVNYQNAHSNYESLGQIGVYVPDRCSIAEKPDSLQGPGTKNGRGVCPLPFGSSLSRG